nr:MAG TPA: hypothetical protein [Caudoviricetes sp.]
MVDYHPGLSRGDRGYFLSIAVLTGDLMVLLA